MNRINKNRDTLFGDNLSDTDDLPDDPEFDFNEFSRQRAFFTDHIGTKSHLDRYFACMYAYFKAWRYEIKDDDDGMEFVEKEHHQEVVPVEALQGLSHISGTEDGCIGHIYLPQEKDGVDLTGYLVSLMINILCFFIDKRCLDNIGYYMTKIPSRFLPDTLLSDQVSFNKRLSSLPNHAFSSLAKSAELINDNNRCNLLVDGPANYYYCDDDLLLYYGEVIYDPDSYGGKGGYVWRPGGCAAYKRWRKKYLRQGSVCVRASVVPELIASLEHHWHRQGNGNGTVDPDLSFSVGEESIGKKPGMGQKFGLVLTSRHVRRSSECQRILLFE